VYGMHASDDLQLELREGRVDHHEPLLAEHHAKRATVAC
jgi:hypothetical protein